MGFGGGGGRGRVRGAGGGGGLLGTMGTHLLLVSKVLATARASGVSKISSSTWKARIRNIRST